MNEEDKVKYVVKFAPQFQLLASGFSLMVSEIEQLPKEKVELLYRVAVEFDRLCKELAK